MPASYQIFGNLKKAKIYEKNTIHAMVAGIHVVGGWK